MSIHKRASISLMAIQIFCYSIAISADLHISLSGDDKNLGTRQSPFLSIERANIAVAEIRLRSPSEPVTVWLHEGTYRFSKSVVFDKMISGVAVSPTVFAAWPGDRVILSGSISLPFKSFNKVDDKNLLNRIIDTRSRDHLLYISLKQHGIDNYGELRRHGFGVYNKQAKTPPVQLYLNGRRLPLARWPNPNDKFPTLLYKFNKFRSGVVARSRVVDPGPKSTDNDFFNRGGTFIVDFDRLKFWSHADDIWLDGIFAESWEWSYNRIAKIDYDSNKITLAYGEINGLPNKQKWGGDFFYAENLLEEIDQPGEWYLDRSTGFLFLYPPTDWHANSTSIELATLNEPLFLIENASHLIFRDLFFENGRDIAIFTRGGTGVIIERCEIRNFSNGAVRLHGKAHGVSASHLHNIGGAVIVLNCGEKETLEPGGCFSINNHIHDWGWYHKVFNGAINIDGVGQKISHNHIHHAPHGAIYIRGNDHLVTYNDFHNLVETFCDMGIIYSGGVGDKPLERGHVIRRNYFHDFGQTFPGQHAVYPDNLAMGWSIEENLFARIGNSNIPSPGNHGVHLNSTSHVNVRKNIFIDCTQPLVLGDYAARAFYPSARLVWEHVITPQTLNKLPHKKRYPELANFWNENRRTPETNYFSQNLIWNLNVPLVDFSSPPNSTFLDGALDKLGTLKLSGNFVTKTNPGFSNPTIGDFSLKPGAELLRRIPEFPNFNIKETGPQTSTFDHF